MNTCYITNTEEVFELVEIILSERYSKEIIEIAKDLLKNGLSTIPEIKGRLKLSFENIRNILIILLQNKLINCQEIFRNEIKYIGYEINIENILNILLYPRLCIFAKEKFGDFGLYIFEEFMNFGILNSPQLIEQIKNKINSNNKNTKDNNNLNVKIKTVLINLIEKNYIVQAKNNNINNNYDKKNNNKELISQKKKDKKENSSNKKNKNKKKKLAEKDDIENNKNLIIIDDDENNINNNKSNKIDENAYLFNYENNTYYFFFFNFEQILCDYKVKIIIEFITQKCGSQVGLIASFMLENNQITSFKTGHSDSFNYQTICHKIKNMNENKILEIINDSNDFFLKITSDTFSLNLEKISNYIKQQIIEKTITQQFSENHLRVYRLLSLCGALDSKNIMENCLIFPKTLNLILNQLYSEGYIQTEIINVKGSNILFYNVDYNKNIEKLVNTSYKIIKNLKKSLNEELETNKNMLTSDMKQIFITKIYFTIDNLCETIIALKYL